MEPPSALNMSAYTQFASYPYASPASQLLVSQSSGGGNGGTGGAGTGGGGTGGGTGGGGGGCTESCRTIMTDPATGQPICSCQYDRLALGSYSRLGSGLGASGAVYSSGAAYPSTDQSPYPSIGVDSTAFYSPLSGAYTMKDGTAVDMSMYGSSLGASPAGYYPYDHAFYGYGAGYDLASRRKNATRESTATLKGWLNDHKKNPYPTKGEKIMLAIITKMTLTQVSTWFANARRRLKKENKMTWEPRNKTDDDDAKISDDEDDEKDAVEKDDDDIKKDDKDGDATMVETKVEEGQTELKSCDGGAPTKGVTAALSPAPPPPHHHNLFPSAKGEKIWSLADTAACKTPPPPQPTSEHGAAGPVWLAGGTTFPLPATIPPNPNQPHQYSRFSHLMPGAIPSQYMAGSYSDGVGTDTPPQTPPNAKGSNGGQNGGNLNVLVGPTGGPYMGGGNGPLAGSGYSLAALSACSTRPDMGSVGQRYQPNGVPGVPPSLPPHTNHSASSGMVSTAFTPVYKTSQQGPQSAQQQQSSPQHQGQQQPGQQSQQQSQQQVQQQQAQQQQQQHSSSQSSLSSSSVSAAAVSAAYIT